MNLIFNKDFRQNFALIIILCVGAYGWAAIAAMIVGVYAVSSLVGGTTSLVEYGRNELLYNSLDAESLYSYIIRLFENSELASEAIKICQIR